MYNKYTVSSLLVIILPATRYRANALSFPSATTHYPCSQAVTPVFTARVILDTREHGPSRSAGAILNDVIIKFIGKNAIKTFFGIFLMVGRSTRTKH